MTRRVVTLYGLMLLVLLGVGLFQSWNVAFGIFNLCLISAVMALGVNMQWGYAGLFNVGIMGFTALGGAFAGLAGYFEVSAVHGSANASLASGYGYTGILVAFLARHNPLAIIPVALLLAGFEASSGLVQRRMDLPDATMTVLQGFVFVSILASEALTGRISLTAWLNRKDTA